MAEYKLECIFSPCLIFLKGRNLTIFPIKSMFWFQNKCGSKGCDKMWVSKEVLVSYNVGLFWLIQPFSFFLLPFIINRWAVCVCYGTPEDPMSHRVGAASLLQWHQTLSKAISVWLFLPSYFPTPHHLCICPKFLLRFFYKAFLLPNIFPFQFNSLSLVSLHFLV